MTKPKAVTEPTPDPSEECRGRLRYPTLDGARTALAALRDHTWGAYEPRQCKTCSGFHLAAPKKQATRGRAA
jgi:hypothetical protein